MQLGIHAARSKPLSSCLNSTSESSNPASVYSKGVSYLPRLLERDTRTICLFYMHNRRYYNGAHRCGLLRWTYPQPFKTFPRRGAAHKCRLHGGIKMGSVLRQQAVHYPFSFFKEEDNKHSTYMESRVATEVSVPDFGVEQACVLV